MTTRVCFINGTTCGIGAGIAEAPLVKGNRVPSTARKPEPATRAQGTLDDHLPVAMDETSKDQVEVPALLPIVAVVFTVGGPLVYQERNRRSA